MYRRILLISLSLMLTSCAAGSLSESRLDSRIREALAAEIQKPSFRKDCYAYYTDPSVGRIDATRTSNTFMYDGTVFTMNLRISEIISRRYYTPEETSVSSHENADIYRSGTYIDLNGQEYPYEITGTMNGERMYLEAVTQFMEFTSVCDPADVPEIAAAMLKTARTVEIDEDEILAAYTSKKSISYTGETVTLFENVPPESGTIEELFIDTNIAGDTTEEMPEQQEEEIPDFSEEEPLSDGKIMPEGSDVTEGEMP